MFANRRRQTSDAPAGKRPRGTTPAGSSGAAARLLRPLGGALVLVALSGCTASVGPITARTVSYTHDGSGAHISVEQYKAQFNGIMDTLGADTSAAQPLCAPGEAKALSRACLLTNQKFLADVDSAAAALGKVQVPDCLWDGAAAVSKAVTEVQAAQRRLVAALGRGDMSGVLTANQARNDGGDHWSSAADQLDAEEKTC